MPLLKKPPREEEEDGDPFATNPESRYRRRATLERLVGLAPFGRARRVPPKDSDGDGSHARRRSEDFGLLRRLPGRRKASVEALAERTVPKRSSLLRLALGTRGRRGSAGERSPTAESDGVSDGDQDSGGQRQEGRGRAREPLSVLEILELIQRRELVAADEQIIALEAECAATSPASPSVSPVPAAGRQARDVALLYEALLAQLWAVLGEAVPVGRPYPPLRLVIRVLEQEEAADRQHPPGTPGRPRALRRRWQEAVGRAAGERLAQVAPAAGLGARLAALAARLVGDLGAVRCHVAPAYPPEYGAFGIYARGYHRALAQQLGALAQRPLAVPDLYLLLDWHSNTYPREVLGHPEVGALLQAQALGPLLPPETQRSLESSCIAAVKAKVEVAVAQELQLSEDTWAEEATGQELQEGLATRVTGLLRAHVERAPQITPEFGREMAHSLLGVLVAFLHSFQRKVERFLEAPGEATPPDGATSRAIALVNCCPPFRTFTERLAQFGHPESEEPRRQAHAALDKVTRLCNHVLTQRLFEDLKPYFNKLMKRKWLTSSDAFDTIVMLITSFSQKLRPLRPEPYQVLVSEVHRRVLIEYVRPLLQGRLVCTSAKMRARVAARLSDEARQLRELFSRLVRAPTHPPQHPWVLLRLGGGDGAEVLAGFGLALAGFGGAAAAGAAGAGGHGGAADGGGRPGEGLPRRPAEARGGGAGREGVAGPNDAPGDPGGGAGPGAERGRAGAAAPTRFFLRAGDDARGALPALPPAPPRPPPPAPPAPPAPRAGPALSSRTHPWVPHRTLVLGAAPRAPSPSSLKLCINGVN